MGVDNIITFDAHDARVQNAIPLNGFETVRTTYQFIKALLRNVDDLQIDSEHMMVISPDEGGMSRAMYYSSVLGLELGMFYKRRNYTVVIDGPFDEPAALNIEANAIRNFMYFSQQ